MNPNIIMSYDKVEIDKTNAKDIVTSGEIIRSKNYKNIRNCWGTLFYFFFCLLREKVFSFLRIIEKNR